MEKAKCPPTRGDSQRPAVDLFSFSILLEVQSLVGHDFGYRHGLDLIDHFKKGILHFSRGLLDLFENPSVRPHPDLFARHAPPDPN
jgi:hypothetical protein